MSPDVIVVFDANALMAQPQFGVDVMDEVERLVGGFEAVVPESVSGELESLADDDGNAEIAVQLIDMHCDIVGDEGDGGDNAMVEVAKGSDYAVTNDKELKSRLLDKGIPVLSLRQRSYLEITYP